MSKTLTLFIDLKKLHSCGNVASLIIRLMMSCNDISLANQCMDKFRKEESPRSQHVQRGAYNYFIRLQCGHLNEAITMIGEIKNDKELSAIVERCSDDVQSAFVKLVDCLKDGPKYQEFQRDIGQIRHTTVFHYDKSNKLITKALSTRADRSLTSTITLGDDVSLCRFELADDILDSIIIRELWKIPRDDNTQKRSDKISDFASDLCKTFRYFSGHFIMKYIEEKHLGK